MQGKVVFLYGNSPEPLPILMMESLRGEGVDVQLIYYDRGDATVSLPMSGLIRPDQAMGIRWPVGEGLLQKAWNRLTVLCLFARKIRKLRPDVVQAWNFDMLIAGIFGCLGRKSSKLVFSLQDTSPWMVTAWGKILQRWAYKRVNLIFVTSQGFHHAFLTRFHLVDENQAVVFLPNVPRAETFRDFVPNQVTRSLTVGHIGLLRGEEGMKTLLGGVEKARESGADVRILFAGKGPAECLAKEAAATHDFVEYRGPYRHNEEILSLYASVDALYGIYDRSYDKEIHLAYRFCEAVNCRIPIIVAAGTHMAAEVERLGVGVAVPLGDANALARELTRLCEPEVRMSIAARCEEAREQFTFEFFEAAMSEAYQGLLKGAKSKGNS